MLVLVLGGVEVFLELALMEAIKRTLTLLVADPLLFLRL